MRRAQSQMAAPAARGKLARIDAVGELAELDEACTARRMGQVVSGSPVGSRHGSGVSACGAALDLRDDVVVVRVEPLRHLPGLALGRAASEGGEHAERVRLDPSGIGVRGDSEHQGRLEDRVVQEEVVDRGADGLALLGEVGLAELGDPGGKRVRVDPAGPGAFERPLQFAIGADAGVADELGVDGRHGVPIFA